MSRPDLILGSPASGNVSRHFTALFLVLLSLLLPPAAAQEKARAVILTDIGGDTDDEQSLVRLLLYSNNIDIEGLCATSRLGHGQDTKPELIARAVAAYGQVYPSLVRHDRGYPEAQTLQRKIKNGLGAQTALGEGFDTEASDWIIQTVDREDKRPVWICVWGGSRELAQALGKVRQTRSKEQLEKFLAQIRVHAIGDQDGHGQWIRENFPSLSFISSGFVSAGAYNVREISCYRGQYMTGDTTMMKRDWVKAHISTGHGPLGALYPPDGHGTDGMKEGDTPSFTYLLPNGLQFPQEPAWGSWGGRFRKLNHNLYIDDQDFYFGSANERHTVARWRPYFQREFAARMDWCVQPYAQANHNPVARIGNDSTHNYYLVEAEAGKRVVLDAGRSSDPDGNGLQFTWWFYEEPGNYRGCIRLKNSHAPKTSFVIPGDAKGKTLHLILEVTDNGQPALTSFRRVLVRVKA